MTINPNHRVKCRCGCWHAEWHRLPDTQEVYRSPYCAECSRPRQLELRDEQAERTRKEEIRWEHLRRHAAAGDARARRQIKQDRHARATVGLPERDSDEDRRQRAKEAQSMMELDRELVKAGILRPRGRRVSR